MFIFHKNYLKDCVWLYWIGNKRYITKAFYYLLRVVIYFLPFKKKNFLNDTMTGTTWKERWRFVSPTKCNCSLPSMLWTAEIVFCCHWKIHIWLTNFDKKEFCYILQDPSCSDKPWNIYWLSVPVWRTVHHPPNNALNWC